MDLHVRVVVVARGKVSATDLAFVRTLASVSVSMGFQQSHRIVFLVAQFTDQGTVFLRRRFLLMHRSIVIGELTRAGEGLGAMGTGVTGGLSRGC